VLFIGNNASVLVVLTRNATFQWLTVHQWKVAWTEAVCAAAAHVQSVTCCVLRVCQMHHGMMSTRCCTMTRNVDDAVACSVDVHLCVKLNVM
jgi:hypothetical protein